MKVLQALAQSISIPQVSKQPQQHSGCPGHRQLPALIRSALAVQITKEPFTQAATASSLN